MAAKCEGKGVTGPENGPAAGTRLIGLPFRSKQYDLTGLNGCIANLAKMSQVSGGAGSSPLVNGVAFRQHLPHRSCLRATATVRGGREWRGSPRNVISLQVFFSK